MKNKLRKIALSVLVIILSACLANQVYSKNKTAEITNEKGQESGQTISNNLFSVTMPSDTKGLYQVIKKDNGIFIYHKESKKDGFGGFAFGIKAYKKPSEHAMMPGGRKLGELSDKKSHLYDIVLVQPTDVQYNYIKGESKSYNKLYNLAQTIDNNISGSHKWKYCNKQGMIGKDLYNDIIQKHITAIKDKWDSTKLEDENMSYMYNVINSSGRNALAETGYAYYDVNDDGTEELFIGEITDGNWKGIVYDIYTMVNRQPAHVVSGGSRNRYFVCNDTFICNDYSGGAAESGTNIYILVENSTELFPQLGVKYDAYENKEKPWFISYDLMHDKWENVSEKRYKERIAVFEKYKKFEYTPFLKFEKQQ